MWTSPTLASNHHGELDRLFFTQGKVCRQGSATSYSFTCHGQLLVKFGGYGIYGHDIHMITMLRRVFLKAFYS